MLIKIEYTAYYILLFVGYLEEMTSGDKQFIWTERTAALSSTVVSFVNIYTVGTFGKKSKKNLYMHRENFTVSVSHGGPQLY